MKKDMIKEVVGVCGLIEKQNCFLRKFVAFSIAEAFIALAITSVVMAASAPLVSKVLKDAGKEVASSKWLYSANKTDIVRREGKMGIGFNPVEALSAKLDVKNTDTSSVSMRITASDGATEDVFQVNKGGTNYFSILNNGRTVIRNNILQIVDANGKKKAELNNSGNLHLQNADSGNAIHLQGSNAHLSLYSPSAKAAETAEIRLYDVNSKLRAFLSAAGSFILRDANNKQRTVITSDGVLSLRDADEVSRNYLSFNGITLYADNSNASSVNLYNVNNTDRVQLHSNGNFYAQKKMGNDTSFTSGAILNSNGDLTLRQTLSNNTADIRVYDYENRQRAELRSDGGLRLYHLDDENNLIQGVYLANGVLTLQPEGVWNGLNIRNPLGSDKDCVNYRSDYSVCSTNGISVGAMGAVRINYKENAGDGTTGPLGIHVDNKQRFWINEHGGTSINYAEDDPRADKRNNYAFQVFVGKQNQGTNSNYTRAFGVKGDGTVEVGGKALTALIESNIDTKLAEYKKELNDTQELVAALKEQNALLSEKVAQLETSLAQTKAQNYVAKISEKSFRNLSK